jgi:hypothetical protein
MGIIFRKRVNLGGGLGLNISKTGISTSYRTRFGSIGPRGFSLRSGIPGLYLLSSFSSGGSRKKKGDNSLILFLLIIIAITLAFVIIWNIIRLIGWIIREIYHANLRRKFKREIIEEVNTNKNPEKIKYYTLNENIFHEDLHNKKFKIKDFLVENETIINAGTNIMLIESGRKAWYLSPKNSGKITFLVFQGEKIAMGDYIYKMELA